MCSLKRRRRQMNLLEWMDGWMDESNMRIYLISYSYCLFICLKIHKRMNVLIIFFHHIQCFNKYTQTHTHTLFPLETSFEFINIFSDFFLFVDSCLLMCWWCYTGLSVYREMERENQHLDDDKIHLWTSSNTDIYCNAYFALCRMYRFKVAIEIIS